MISKSCCVAPRNPVGIVASSRTVRVAPNAGQYSATELRSRSAPGQPGRWMTVAVACGRRKFLSADPPRPIRRSAHRHMSDRLPVEIPPALATEPAPQSMLARLGTTRIKRGSPRKHPPARVRSIVGRNRAVIGSVSSHRGRTRGSRRPSANLDLPIVRLAYLQYLLPGRVKGQFANGPQQKLRSGPCAPSDWTTRSGRRREPAARLIDLL